MVTSMGDWMAGSTFVRSHGSPLYVPAERDLVGAVDAELEGRVYEVVNEWVCWTAGVLRVTAEKLRSQFPDNGSIAAKGDVDRGQVSELHAIWSIACG